MWKRRSDLLVRWFTGAVGPGATAGLVGGLASGGAGAATSGADGLLGLELSGLGLLFHVVLATAAGVAFGYLFRYQSRGHAALISNSLLYGLLLWIIGPLTLAPFLTGNVPTWSAADAGASFSSLIIHLLYGGITGVGCLVIVALSPRRSSAPALSSEADKTHVVILGGGFGGVSTAQRLEQLLWRDSGVGITLLSQSNYLLFTPMLAEVAASALEPQHIGAPVRAALPRTNFRRCDVTAIDTAGQMVLVRDGPLSAGKELHYDHLVLALGSVPNYFGLPGMEEHAFSLKTLDDATRLRNHVIAQFEQADAESDFEERRRQLTFVVAGGGFAGTEMIAELFDLAHSVVRYYPSIHREEMRFVLIHSRDRILPELGEKLAAYALQKLRARGIVFMLGIRVAGATPQGVLISDGEEIPSRTVVWTAGNQPNPILATLACEKNRAGAAIAESTLRLKSFTNVWVVGDCGEIPDPSADGKAYPPTAQHAIREGKMAANNIAASLYGRPVKPFRFRAMGMLVPLGHRTGVAEFRGVRFSGLLAWLMWRGIYVTLLPGLERKVRVLFDWLMDLLFPRDIVLTGGASTPTLGQMIHEDGAAVTSPPDQDPDP